VEKPGILTWFLIDNLFGRQDASRPHTQDGCAARYRHTAIENALVKPPCQKHRRDFAWSSGYWRKMALPLKRILDYL
jgi:hypothetical protein